MELGSRRVYYNHVVWGGWEILIGRHASGIARDRLYGPTVPVIAAIGAIVREIIVLHILQVIVPATVVRLTDQAIRRVTTGREIVPARRVVHQFNRPVRERLVNRNRAALRSLVTPDHHIQTSLVRTSLVQTSPV